MVESDRPPDDRVLPEEAPAAEDAAPAPDPVLVEIRDQLQALVESNLPDAVAVDSLFTIRLEDPGGVARRISLLEADVAALAANLAGIRQRLTNAEAEIPEPRSPPELDRSLEEPAPVAPPLEPTRPQFKRPVGKKAPWRSSLWLERSAAWEKYDADIESYQDEHALYQERAARYEADLEAYRAGLAAREAAAQQLGAEQAARRQAVAQLRQELLREAADTEIRIDIARARLTYLEALHGLIRQFPDPAMATFANLKAPRDAVRAKAKGLAELEAQIRGLVERIQVLQHRAQAGSLIGFQVRVEQLVQDTDTVAQALVRRGKTAAELAESLVQLADELERKGASLRRLIFIQATNRQRAQVIDRAFMENVTQMRQAGQRHSLLGDRSVSPESEVDLLSAISKILESPATIGQVTDGTNALTQVKSLVEIIDGVLDSARVDLERFHQAFRREAVTVLGSLASTETRRRAYSLSRELLADLVADLANLKSSLTRWAKDKWERTAQLPSKILTRDGVVLITRLVLAAAILLAVMLLWRRISKLVALGIRRFSASRLFRHRVGSLVRLAGLAENVLPTLVLAAAVYCALALVGFSEPEVRFAEVAVRWIAVYALGRRFLEGLTRRVSRGRPAFIPLSVENATRLSVTYGRLGLFVALGGIAHEWVRDWLGAGLLGALLVWAIWLWAAIWAVWAFFSWRVPLARALTGQGPEGGTIRRFGAWMETHRIAFVCTPLAFVLILIGAIFRKMHGLLTKEGLFAYLRARSLRRLAKSSKLAETSIIPPALPEKYIREFPLYPIYAEEDAVLLPRRELVAAAVDQLERWRATRQDSSLVVLGDKGIGKTTFLTLLEREIDAVSTTRYSLSKKLRSEKALAQELGALFEVPDAESTGVLASKLNSGAERVVLLDEAHNVFLRVVDGYDAYEALIRLVNYTSEKVLWVLVFNSYSWFFLNESRKRVHYFRRLMSLPAWTRDQLRELISRRNKRSGVEIEFDEMLLDESRSATGDFEVIDGAEGFFRLLWEASKGNPRVATRLWLDALKPVTSSRIRVGLFPEGSAAELVKMDQELLFTLAAVCQHENLSVAELRDVINVETDFAGFAMRFLTEYELLEPKHNDPRRSTLAPRFYPHVLDVLRQHHLLLEKE